MWNPPPSVTEHHGEPLAPKQDFFVAPPAGIGPVRSAHSSLNQGVRAKSSLVRAAIALAAGVAGFFLVIGFNRMTNILLIATDLTHTPPALWAGLFAILPVYAGWRKSAFRHSCNFVGPNGCAQYTCADSRANLVQNSVFLFTEAASVAIRQVRHTKNGVYNGTDFWFHWYSSDHNTAVFFITGYHHADAKTPPPENLYNFARAAESAWYDFLTPKINAELARQGFVKFYMGVDRWAVLGPGFIQIVDKEGRASRCGAEDIGSVKLDDGVLTIRRKDARSSLFNLFNHEGIFGFNYSSVHNARLFLYLFEKSLGIRVQ